MNVFKDLPSNLILATIFLLYFVSRGVGIFYFVPHNDEAIYAQIALMMEYNWDQYKYISLNGNLNNDYKVPLQFWVNSLTVVNEWKNPILGVRIWSILLGFCGLFFTQLLIKHIWNKTAAIFTAGLIVFSEYYFYFDSIGLNEVFLYGFGAAYLFFLYDTLKNNNWISGILSILGLTATLLSKTSGALWLIYTVLLPLVIVTIENPTFNQMIQVLKTNGIRWYGSIGGIILGAAGIYYLLIPSEFDVIKTRSLQAGMVRDLGEIFEFPWAGWISNVQFYWDNILWVNFSYAALPLLGGSVMVAVWLSIKDRGSLKKYLMLTGLYVSSFVPIILVAKTQAVRYFGMGLYFLYMLIAVALSIVWKKLHFYVQISIILVMIPLLIGWKIQFSWMPLVQWGQTELALKETPPGWSNGAGIMELIHRISQLPPGVMVLEDQWGFPTTAIKVFGSRYPQLDALDLNMETATNLKKYYEQSPYRGKNLYFVMDARVPGERSLIDFILNTERICTPKEIIQKRFGDQIFQNTSLVICWSTFVPNSFRSTPKSN